MTADFQKFIQTGELPASMAARTKILDIARNQILTNIKKNPVTLISLTNKSGKLKLSEAIQKSSVDSLPAELGKIFGAKAAAAGNSFGGLANCMENAADTLDIEIHSPGGSVLDGYRVYHAIRELRNRGVFVTAHINSLAASMASVVCMACDRITMVQGGKMMIHDVHTSAGGNAAQLTKSAKLVDEMSEEIAGIYANRTKQPVKTIREMMKAETWMGAAEALRAGFIDEIISINNTSMNKSKIAPAPPDEMAKRSNDELRKLADLRFSTVPQVAAAKNELAQRGVSFGENGIVSESRPGGRAFKNARK